MNGTGADKQPARDASNDLLEENKDYKAPSQDDAASSNYNNNDDVEKAQPLDTTESVDDVAEKRGDVKESDPNIVDFDGDNDPECALNWSLKKKWTMGGLLSAMTFVTFVPSATPNSYMVHIS
jgi:DHA1 family multidrug resistance protein-like MFS transporter